MKVAILGIDIDAPGLRGWDAAREVLAGRVPWMPGGGPSVERPVPASVADTWPASARQAIAVGAQALAVAGLKAADVPAVFASCGGDGEAMHRLCESVAREQADLPPHVFRDALHDATAAYWHSAWSSAAPSTSLCAFDGTFAAGMLEAAARAITEYMPVLLVAGDLPYPSPLSSLWNASLPCTAALVLAPRRDRHQAAIDIRLEAAAAEEDWPPGVGAELRTNPSAAAIPLFALLARGEGRAVLPCHGDRAVVATWIEHR